MSHLKNTCFIVNWYFFFIKITTKIRYLELDSLWKLFKLNCILKIPTTVVSILYLSHVSLITGIVSVATASSSSLYWLYALLWRTPDRTRLTTVNAFLNSCCLCGTAISTSIWKASLPPLRLRVTSERTCATQSTPVCAGADRRGNARVNHKWKQLVECWTLKTGWRRWPRWWRPQRLNWFLLPSSYVLLCACFVHRNIGNWKFQSLKNRFFSFSFCLYDFPKYFIFLNTKMLFTFSEQKC